MNEDCEVVVSGFRRRLLWILTVASNMKGAFVALSPEEILLRAVAKPCSAHLNAKTSSSSATHKLRDTVKEPPIPGFFMFDDR
jgi:hypothetical protein